MNGFIKRIPQSETDSRKAAEVAQQVWPGSLSAGPSAGGFVWGPGKSLAHDGGPVAGQVSLTAEQAGLHDHCFSPEWVG